MLLRGKSSRSLELRYGLQTFSDLYISSPTAPSSPLVLSPRPVDLNSRSESLQLVVG